MLTARVIVSAGYDWTAVQQALKCEELPEELPHADRD
jgi:hypothetical protein